MSGAVVLMSCPSGKDRNHVHLEPSVQPDDGLDDGLDGFDGGWYGDTAAAADHGCGVGLDWGFLITHRAVTITMRVGLSGTSGASWFTLIPAKMITRAVSSRSPRKRFATPNRRVIVSLFAENAY